jgi:hypothetical protein
MPVAKEVFMLEVEFLGKEKEEEKLEVIVVYSITSCCDNW